ncbi:unnamed protein product [Prorocentrum cordatum]|uniref:Uncharacterized protein n=1 Tax=Prorocentrum cordatum TaxID=2364126 RepID=A0ABN9XKF6_9DINO|nr:unnamed protein product [Polarella glacialis]
MGQCCTTTTMGCTSSLAFVVKRCQAPLHQRPSSFVLFIRRPVQYVSAWWSAGQLAVWQLVSLAAAWLQPSGQASGSSPSVGQSGSWPVWPEIGSRPFLCAPPASPRRGSGLVRSRGPGGAAAGEAPSRLAGHGVPTWAGTLLSGHPRARGLSLWQCGCSAPPRARAAPCLASGRLPARELLSTVGRKGD